MNKAIKERKRLVWRLAYGVTGLESMTVTVGNMVAGR